MKSPKWTRIPLPNPETVKQLSESININSILASILVQRGIADFDSARAFFSPQLDELHNPFLMKDMDKAVERLIGAVSNNEKILVYGDYDVDGTTAVSMLYSFLKSFYPHVDYYIPDRYTEGYGVSFRGVEYAADNDFKLIVSLDCGIKSVDKVQRATELGVDFIICDHHLPGNELPPALAVLDPKRPDCPYPFKELCGCGVGFKLIQAFCQHQGWPDENYLHYLDLVAISIAADIVPVTGENRTLSHFGIIQLNPRVKRPGIKALLEKANVKRPLTITDLVFVIAPRINAAGRITSGREAVQLLIEHDHFSAAEISIKIDQNNSFRKDLDKSITLEALEQIESVQGYANAKTTVVYHESWHKGVVGIVASRLTETYYRPTIVLTKSGDKLAGSARSVSGFDVYQAIEACSGHLEQFGGHKYAAGLTLSENQLEAFRQAFEKTVANSISESLLTPEIEYDAELDFAQITPKFISILNRMAPFGPENMQPVFYTENVQDAGWAKIVGENHLKCLLFDDKNPGLRIDAIGFKLGDRLPLLKSKKPFKILYCIEQNSWNDQISTQLVIKDIKPLEGNTVCELC